jgi:hypothetical protein
MAAEPRRDPSDITPTRERSRFTPWALTLIAAAIGFLVIIAVLGVISWTTHLPTDYTRPQSTGPVLLPSDQQIEAPPGQTGKNR